MTDSQSIVTLSTSSMLDITAISRPEISIDRLTMGPAGQPVNVACCLLVAAVAFTNLIS